jgi:hypothetical protein
LSTFYKEMFCDFIHKTEKGHKLTAEYLNSKMTFKKYNKIWFLGGSTTEGKDCNDLQKTFSDFLYDMYPTKLFVNHGKNSKNSDYSINMLTHLLSLGKKADVIIWGHWINEFLVQGDSTDINYEKLRKNFDLGKNLKEAKLIKFIQRLNLSLYRKSSFFQLFTNMTMSLVYRVRVMFVAHNNEDGSANLGEEKSLFPNSFKNQEKMWLDYALANYELNLIGLNQLSKKNKFDVVLVFMPYVESIYKKDNIQMHSLLEKKWYPRVKNLMQKTSIKYNWNFIDLSMLFKKH